MSVSPFKLWVPFSAAGVAVLCLWINGARNVSLALLTRSRPSVEGEVIHVWKDRARIRRVS